jgi:hypothetical protein
MKKRLFFIYAIILSCVVIFIGVPYQNRKTKREFDLFYSSQLSGKIINMYTYSRGANFILDNNPRKFSFYPYVNKELNNNEIFQYIAKPGDSIYKPAYSDTLFLIKKNAIYSYLFQKHTN